MSYLSTDLVLELPLPQDAFPPSVRFCTSKEFRLLYGPDDNGGWSVDTEQVELGYVEHLFWGPEGSDFSLITLHQTENSMDGKPRELWDSQSETVYTAADDIHLIETEERTVNYRFDGSLMNVHHNRDFEVSTGGPHGVQYVIHERHHVLEANYVLLAQLAWREYALNYEYRANSLSYEIDPLGLSPELFLSNNWIENFEYQVRWVGDAPISLDDLPTGGHYQNPGMVSGYSRSTEFSSLGAIEMSASTGGLGESVNLSVQWDGVSRLLYMSHGSIIIQNPTRRDYEEHSDPYRREEASLENGMTEYFPNERGQPTGR
jgi:hypothetical protein